jgi:hypothetical protein
MVTTRTDAPKLRRAGFWLETVLSVQRSVFFLSWFSCLPPCSSLKAHLHGDAHIRANGGYRGLFGLRIHGSSHSRLLNFSLKPGAGGSTRLHERGDISQFSQHQSNLVQMVKSEFRLVPDLTRKLNFFLGTGLLGSVKLGSLLAANQNYVAELSKTFVKWMRLSLRQRVWSKLPLS